MKGLLNVPSAKSFRVTGLDAQGQLRLPFLFPSREKVLFVVYFYLHYTIFFIFCSIRVLEINI